MLSGKGKTGGQGSTGIMDKVNRSNIKRVNNKQQSFHAPTGRIEIRKLQRLIDSHIDSKNFQAALKAIDLYKQDAQHMYAQHMDHIKEWNRKIKKISTTESEIEQYKRELLNGSD